MRRSVAADAMDAESKKKGKKLTYSDANRPTLEMRRYLGARLEEIEVLLVAMRPVIGELIKRFKNELATVREMSQKNDNQQDVAIFIRRVHLIMREDAKKYTGELRLMQRKMIVVAESAYDLVEEMRQAVLSYNEMLSDGEKAHMKIKPKTVPVDVLDSVKWDKKDRMFKPKEASLFIKFLSYINNGEKPPEEIVDNALLVRTKLPLVLTKCAEECENSLAKLDSITRVVQHNYAECIAHLRLFTLRVFVRANK